MGKGCAGSLELGSGEARCAVSRSKLSLGQELEAQLEKRRRLLQPRSGQWGRERQAELGNFSR